MALSLYLRECAERVAGILGHDVDASITLQDRGVTLRASSSSAGAGRCDKAEVLAGEGPCIEAMRNLSTRLVVSVVDEPRWARWREQTVREGYVTSLAVPAAVSPTAAIALNLYSRDPGTWQAPTVSAAKAFAVLIAAAIRLRMEPADLDAAWAGRRETISGGATRERALGAIMEVNDCPEVDAREILASESRVHGVSQRAEAESILRSLVVGGAAGDIVDSGGR